jgi:hypothetical protein
LALYADILPFAIAQGKIFGDLPPSSTVEGIMFSAAHFKICSPIGVDPVTQASKEQHDKILSYVEIGKQEGAKLLMGGKVATLGEGLDDGYYIQPTAVCPHPPSLYAASHTIGTVHITGP